MFVDILSAIRQSNVTPPKSLTTGIMSGASCPKELVEEVRKNLGMKDLIVMYGMTETSPVTFQCFPDDPPDVRSSTIGFPSVHTEVRTRLFI